MRTLFITLAICGVLSMPGMALAQTPSQNQIRNVIENPVLLEPIPGVAGKTGSKFDFPAFMRGLFSALLAIGAILAVFMLVYGGISYMMSDVVGNKAKAKERMRDAVLGLLLLIGSVLILRTINPNLLNFDLRIPERTGDTLKLQTPSKTI
jgi:hypothetical protein